MNRYIAISLCTLVASVTLLAQPGGAHGSANAASAYKSEEYLLLGDATRGAGEPMLAVDPTNPKNIVVVGLGILGELPPPPPGGVPGRLSIPRSTIASLAVTHDGGMNWDFGVLPVVRDSTFTRCGDPIANVTKEGVFLAGCEPRETTGELYGGSFLVASTDKGITWGPRVDIISSFDAQRFAPGLKPSFKSASPWDRPYIFVDDSNGVIYGVALGGRAVSDTDPAKSRREAYVTASTDGARSFGTIYSWDSKDYPQIGGSVGFTAANGTVAAVYLAGQVPASDQAKCPCYVMALSRDEGKMFTYHVLKNIPPQPAPAETPGRAATRARSGGAAAPAPPIAQGPSLGGGLSNALTADPTTPGRYALLISVSGDAPQYQVSVSDDSGQTWTSPVVAGAVPDAVRFNKSAFKYSRDGVLGLTWRAYYADNTYDVWSSISKDGGKTFSAPLRVSHAKSPGSLPVKGVGSSDDIMDLAMDKDNLYMVWGDYRSGFLGTWFGRVPFSAFDFPSH